MHHFGHIKTYFFLLKNINEIPQKNKSLLGFGFGLIYLPAIVSVTVYFDKHRSLATGIAVCGSGVGTMVLSPVIKELMNNYQWQSTSVMVGCLILTCILFGCTFIPVAPVKTSECVPLKNQVKK